MTNAKIIFPEVFKGYDMEQVDRYITKLSAAYQEAYDENTAIRARYNNLLEAFKQLNAQEQEGMDPEIVLMYAEMLAQKIITDAQADAALVRAEAQKVFAETTAAAAQAKSQAQKMLQDANAEAARIVLKARKSLLQANDLMEKTVNKILGMMTFNAPEAKSTKAG